jgi:vacuolar-type H+-ATPase subunit H
MADNAGTRASCKNKDEAVKESQAFIKGPESAKKWLTENELTLKDEELTMSSMAAALLQLCSGRFHQLKDTVCGMRAIALCMEEIIQTRHTTNALDTVKEQVEDIVKEAREAIEELVGGIRSAMKVTEEHLTKQRSEGTSTDVEKIIEKAVQSASKPSYAQAIGNNINPRTTSRDLQIENDTKARTKLQRGRSYWMETKKPGNKLVSSTRRN